MVYKLMVRVGGVWQEMGLRHATPEDARNEARTFWCGYAFMVLPE